MSDRPQYYGDDHLWIVLAVTAYIKETGNRDFLSEQIPFYDKENGKEIESATVMEHLRRSRFHQNNTGKHGLPLLGLRTGTTV